MEEEMIIAAILMNPQLFDEIIKELDVDDFSDKEYKNIYQAMNKCYLDGILPGINAVANYYPQINHEKVVNIFEQVPDYFNLKMAINNLKEKSRKTKLVNAVSEMEDLLKKGFKTDEVYKSYKQKLESITNKIDTEQKNYIEETFDEIVERKSKVEKGEQIINIPTGYTNLDFLTEGLHETELTILAARPAMGKTSLALNFILRQLKNDIPVAIFSLEMSAKLLIKRLFSIHSGIDAKKITTGKLTDSEIKKVMSAADFLASKKNKFWIFDKSDIGIEDIISNIRPLLQHGLKVVYIDYLQLINTSSVYKNRALEIGEISRNLKILAKEFNIAIVAVAQLNREVEHRNSRRPILADLRDSGEIEQNADNVWFLYRESYYLEQEAKSNGEDLGATELSLAKHRNGPTGVVNLIFRKNTLEFLEEEKV